MACAGKGNAGWSADLFGNRHETGLGLRLLFHQPLRQTEGLLHSIAAVLGISIAIPDHTTLSRRGGGLTILPKRIDRAEPLHLLVDSTGLIRIDNRSSPLFCCVKFSASCIATADLAAPVTLGNSNQCPSPSSLKIRPPWAIARRSSNVRYSSRRACRSPTNIVRNIGVEPTISVFIRTVVRSVMVAKSMLFRHICRQRSTGNSAGPSVRLKDGGVSLYS
jgi:hypothetical protein